MDERKKFRSYVEEMRQRYENANCSINAEDDKINLSKPPPKPPRTFAHDLFLSNPSQVGCSQECSQESSQKSSQESSQETSKILKRRSKSFEQINSDPATKFTEEDDKFKKIRSGAATQVVSKLNKEFFIATEEGSSKQSRVKDIIKQSFSAFRKMTIGSKIERTNLEDDKSDISLKEIEERIIYVQTLKRNYSRDGADYYSTLSSKSKEISLCRCFIVINEPNIVTVIPQNIKLNNSRLIEELTNFNSLDMDYYWFTIWTKDDKLLYVYCEKQNRFKRRVCLVSDIYFPELYIRIFRCFENKEDIEASIITFLKQTCSAFPGDELTFLYLNVEVPFDCQINIGKQSDILHLINPTLIVEIISSLLHERRVTLVSKHEQRLLNSCRQIVSLLYPFSWDYMFWPLVPSHLLSLCAAINLPFLIGIKSKDVWSFLNLVKKKENKHLVIDLDRNLSLIKIGDENKILPSKIQKAVISALDLCLSMNDPQEKFRDVVVRETFLEMFLALVGTSRIYVSEDTFDKEHFISSYKSRSHQSFLQWFTETGIFSNFVKFMQLRIIQSKLHPKYNQFIKMGLFEIKSLRLANDFQARTSRSLFNRFKSSK